MRETTPRRGLRRLALGLAGLAASAAFAADPAGEALIKEKCQACHEPAANGALPRIDEGRRTPEGWDMTLVRMMQFHGVKLGADERRVLVKHLADTRGLAPAETRGWRHVLERRPGVVEVFPNKEIGDTCGRCHSYARIALQRRTEADWLKLANYHVGQYPTIELQSGGRDRNWWEIATGPVNKALGKLYPLDAEAWKRWQAAPKADPAGTWRLAGHRPGWGAYEGRAEVERRGPDSYGVKLTINYADGRTERAEGSATLFSGYEWRASLDQGGKPVRQVLSLSEDGTKLSGRWFLADADVLGGDLSAVRDGAGAKPAIVAVHPAHLKAGTRQTVAIHGVALDGEPAFGPGVRVERVVSRAPDKLVVELAAGAKAAPGLRTVSVGGARADGALAVYRRIDQVRVEPAHGLARVGADGATNGDGGKGGAGGAVPKVPAQFDAVAYANGRDGKPGTRDDLRIGVMSASWHAENLNEAAIAMRDMDFVGKLSDNGLFVPAGAGPNRARKYATNNAGELRIVASVKDGARTVKGSAPLVVTVQRWNDPPIH